MIESPHHIRLAAAIEVALPGAGAARTLDRDCARTLAGALAEDLARVVAEVDCGRLTVAGCLLEPAELLQPGFPAWQALATLPGMADRAPGILAVGAHGGRMPAAALQPPAGTPAGSLLVLPLMLVVPEDRASALESALERELFERASLHPPALSAIAATAFEPVHGQLMTCNDLLALVRVQLSAAGLDPFWPPVEHVLLAPDNDAAFDLPAGLAAESAGDRLRFEFRPFRPRDGEATDYLLWLRAFRQATALAAAHGIAWEARSELAAHPEGWLTDERGPEPGFDRAAAQADPDAGIVAWSLRMDGRRRDLYPLTAAAAGQLEKELGERLESPPEFAAGLCYDADGFRLPDEPSRDSR